MPIMVEDSCDLFVLIFLITISASVFVFVLRACFEKAFEAIDKAIADKINGDDRKCR